MAAGGSFLIRRRGHGSGEMGQGCQLWDGAQVLQDQGRRCGQRGDADPWWVYSFYLLGTEQRRDTPGAGVLSPPWGKIQQPAPASPLPGHGVGQAPR